MLVHPAEYLEGADAVWSTFWPTAEYVNHEWAGIHPTAATKRVWDEKRYEYVEETPGNWMNQIFRNESALLSSDLIRAAVAATRSHWPEYVPEGGLITMIDAEQVASSRQQGRHAVGWSYRKAGFREVGVTQSKPYKRVFQLLPEDMPQPSPAQNPQLSLI